MRDADERSEFLEQRFKYVARFQKLLRRPQAQDVLEILRLYGQNCIPIPRKTERHYWSVSCLPSTSDKPLVRVNASWMELFTLYADGEGIRARFIVHLSDFTTDHSAAQGQVDEAFLEHCVTTPEDVGYFFPRGEDIFGINVRGSASIRKFLASPPVLRAIRTFQSDAHEPGAERLPGEPLLQRGGSHAGRLSGSGMPTALASLPRSVGFLHLRRGMFHGHRRPLSSHSREFSGC